MTAVVTAGRLLKADSLPQRSVAVSFAFTDIEQECHAQLVAAQEEARQLILEAEEHAELLRADAQEMGLTTGTLQAEAEFEEAVEAEVQLRVQQRLKQLVPALQSATTQLIRDHEQILLQWESAVVRLSLTLAERILRRELEIRPAAPQALVAEALQLTAGSSSVLLRMHPADVSDMEAHSVEWQQLLSTQQNLKVVADSKISPGGCLLETLAGEIDGRIETQLARIAAELLGEGR